MITAFNKSPGRSIPSPNEPVDVPSKTAPWFLYFLKVSKISVFSLLFRFGCSNNVVFSHRFWKYLFISSLSW